MHIFCLEDKVALSNLIGRVNGTSHGIIVVLSFRSTISGFNFGKDEESVKCINNRM